VSIAKAKVEFVAPMLALAVAKLPEGSAWSYELNSMINRTICVKARGKVHL
jgi:hypothetical protein